MAGFPYHFDRFENFNGVSMIWQKFLLFWTIMALCVCVYEKWPARRGRLLKVGSMVFIYNGRKRTRDFRAFFFSRDGHETLRGSVDAPRNRPAQ